MKYNYSRGNIPSAGFTAGPCLFKDTMQLSAFSNNNFSLGMEAMSTNEGLVNYIVDKIKRGDQNNNGAVKDPDKIISFKSL